jgi:GNAT superfamily N-acetyltransferase
MTKKLTVREATPAEIVTVLSHTRPLWGGGKGLDTYLARTRALLESPWGQAHYRFVVGLDESGTILTTCKRYHLDLRLDGTPAPTVGFGAVFTPEAHRGQGHAATLLQAVMAEERTRGTRLALLFSDIGPEYYERLGFQAIRCEIGEAPAASGEAPFLPIGDRDPAELLAFCREPDARLAFGRSPDYWAFMRERHRPELLLYAPDGLPQGFAAIHDEAEGLWVDEAGFAPGVSPRAFWLALRALAADRERPAVSGWLPRETGEAGFTFRPLTTNAPMAAPLSGDVIPEAVQLWANDHF